MDRVILSLKNIRKFFGPVQVLKGVDFELQSGEVHVLAGENGAGKSTLIKIAAGVHSVYEGEVRLNGSPVRFSSPHDASDSGISVIYQEMSLIDSMSVADNMFLGREFARGIGGALINRRLQERKADKFCKQLGLELDLRRKVEEFPMSVKNRIEIAKALARKARVIIMDEPTSALSKPEVERLFEIISDLKNRGCGIIYISHRMEEIYRIADRITVLRDGCSIGTEEASKLPEQKLIHWMIGRELSSQFPERKCKPGKICFSVKDFSVLKSSRRTHARGVSLRVHSGEIVGIAGLQGSGNSELLSGLFGACGSRYSGKIEIDGRPFALRSPGHSIHQGLAHLTNDRKTTGLVLGMDIRKNITLASLGSISRWGFLLARREVKIAGFHFKRFLIRAASVFQRVGALSGGNQQKVALAKWLECNPRVLLLDEPTRGVDVGAKHEIYDLMNEWCEQGKGIILITSEMSELLGMADRILVMHRGEVTAEFSRSEATQEKILKAAMGGVV